MKDEKRAALAFIAEIDDAELAVRLMAIAIGLKRTPDYRRTPREIIADSTKMFEEQTGTPFPFGRMARAAIEYVGECIENGQRPS